MAWVEVPAADEKPPTRDRADEDEVAQLAGVLRAARRAHRAYLAELRLGDTTPAEDWSTWYAEYLLGKQ